MPQSTQSSDGTLNLQRRLRTLHVIVTAQFFFAAAVIIAYFFLESDSPGWAAFSLSAQTLVLLVLAVLAYAFAVARGVVGERNRDEHPFTAYYPYRLFYLVVPILSGIAGALFYLFTEGTREILRGAALGTVLPACVIWLFIDPLIGLVESLLPGARRLRRLRLQKKRARQQERARRKEILLRNIRDERLARLEQLRPFIRDRAERLAALLLETGGDLHSRADAAALIGLEVWQAGGLPLMKELAADTLLRLPEPRHQALARLLDDWWDTVGDWRARPSASANMS